MELKVDKRQDEIRENLEIWKTCEFGKWKMRESQNHVAQELSREYKSSARVDQTFIFEL